MLETVLIAGDDDICKIAEVSVRVAGGSRLVGRHVGLATEIRQLIDAVKRS